MFFDFQGLNEAVFPFPDLVRPAEPDGEQGHDFLDAAVVGQARVLPMEAAPFQALEQILDLPPQAVGGKWVTKPLVRRQHQQFTAVQPHAAEPNPLAADAEGFSQEAVLTLFQVPEA